MRLLNLSKLRILLIGIWTLLGPLIIMIFFAYSYMADAKCLDPLPKNFKIYVNKQGSVFTKPGEGLEEKVLPTFNLFLYNPGCYVLCNTKNADRGIYSVSADTYAIGQIRVQGEYDGSVCVPYDYDKSDLENSEYFKALCSDTYKCIGDSCWADGNTGKWFGLS